MLDEGLLLLAMGMGTVFVFLALMVLVMQATGVYFKANEARFRDPEAPVRRPRTAGTDAGQIAAVIAAAVHAHRK